MYLPTQALSMLIVLCSLHAAPALSQTAAATAAATAAVGPVLLPGASESADFAGLLAFGIQRGAVGARLDGMYTGVPGADLVAFTGNVVWGPRWDRPGALQPYLIAGVGGYVKFYEQRFGVNAGLGVRRRAGPLWLVAEARYHRVTSRFEEQPGAATFIPVLVGVSVGN
jgi:hypothetical protein